MTDFRTDGAAALEWAARYLERVDELPVLGGSDLELVAGMVFALEPKFVLPGLGAIGIENTWLVTDAGLERLTLAAEHIYEVG